MRVAVTGATGFLGRYIVNHLLESGHRCRCWSRPDSDRGGLIESGGPKMEWLPGELGDPKAAQLLVENVDAVVHSALQHGGGRFRATGDDLMSFVEANVLGTLRLIQAARRANVRRFIFISTCAVHDVILQDRPLDETHPLWPKSHYGAHKAAIEKFVHSFGLGEGYDICALRPTGIYGLARPVSSSKWYGLVHAVKAGRPVESSAGGKEVHAADVAKAVGILLTASGIAGQAYNCYDMYISDEMVARTAACLTGSDSRISNLNTGPKNQIDTGKLRALGMTFGGQELLEQTVRDLLAG
ncbi:MAG: NAD(P)-dependent oxidoreductase [Phycisphaerae bacterium]|nr:NAD(P)-dependent oxidoreductase [Phycisphaerae bacterium]